MADRSRISLEREQVLAALADGEHRTARDLSICIPTISRTRVERICAYLQSRGQIEGRPGIGWRRQSGKGE